MSVTQAPGRVAYGITESLRQSAADRLASGLAAFVLACGSLYIMVGDTPFMRSDVDHSTDISPVNRYVWLSLLVVSAPILWLRRRAILPLLRAIWPMLVLFAWFGLTTAWAIDPAASVRRVLLYYVLLVIFAAVATGLRRPNAWHLVIAVSGGAVMLVDLIGWPIVPNIAMTDLGFAGLHAQKNVAGEIALLAALAQATYLALGARGALRPALWGLLVATCLVLAASESATSVSLGMAMLVALPLLVRVLRGSRASLAAVFGAGALAVAAVVFGYFAWAGVSGADPLAPLNGVTFTERTDLWNFSLGYIRQRPLTGWGFGSFWAIDPALQPSVLSGEWFGQGTEVANQGHDDYLDITVTTGLIGLGLTLMVVTRAMVLAVRTAARGGSMFPLGFLLVTVVHGVTESSLFTPNGVFGSFFVLTALQLEAARLASLE